MDASARSLLRTIVNASPSGNLLPHSRVPYCLSFLLLPPPLLLRQSSKPPAISKMSIIVSLKKP